MKMQQIAGVVKSCLLALSMALTIAVAPAEFEIQYGKSGHETHGKSIEAD